MHQSPPHHKHSDGVFRVFSRLLCPRLPKPSSAAHSCTNAITALTCISDTPTPRLSTAQRQPIITNLHLPHPRLTGPKPASHRQPFALSSGRRSTAPPRRHSPAVSAPPHRLTSAPGREALRYGPAPSPAATRRALVPRPASLRRPTARRRP